MKSGDYMRKCTSSSFDLSLSLSLLWLAHFLSMPTYIYYMQVRERWTCQLNPGRMTKDQSPWTPDEIIKLFEARYVLYVWN